MLKTSNTIKWSARIIGIIVGTLWGISLIISFIAETMKGVTPSTEARIQGIALAVLIVILIAGIIIAWRRELPGAIIIITAAAALCIFSYLTAGHNKHFAVLISGFPFLVVGVLFFVHWWRRSKRGNI